MTLRREGNERFTGALFAVELHARDAAPEERPFARALAPDRLAAGRFTTEDGISFGVRAAIQGAELKAEASSRATAELQPFYVVAEGLGESDPAWRYKTTETMAELEGSYRMGLIAQVPRGFSAEARISLEAIVHARGRRTEVKGRPEEHIGRLVLPT